MDSLVQYNDIPTNERFYKKYTDNGKFTIKDKKKECNFPDIVLECKQATELVNWLNTYVHSTHHYMIDLIVGSSNDIKIAKFLKNKLPYDCEIDSDELFLKIQYPDIDEYDNDIMCDYLQIPTECITYCTTKKDNTRKYNIIYLTWENISGELYKLENGYD